MKISINLNEFVWVKLTAEGEKVIQAYESVGTTNKRKVNNDLPNDWYRFQLWDLMNIFGPHIKLSSLGCFFKNKIHFNPPDKF